MAPLIDDCIESRLQQTAAELNGAIAQYLNRIESVDSTLLDAMRYSMTVGGKRLRPALVLWCCDACEGSRETAWPAAIAMECVHTFSLIHDDLPAIDNDDLRRGRPTNHAVFGEATAILAGDALLTLAFEILATDVPDPALSRRMIKELARATGSGGMIGGEMADVAGESHAPDLDRVARIHDAKTARLIQASCRLGAMAAAADEKKYAALSEFGLQLGRAFQIVDDLLDETSSTDALGKRAGKDAAKGKQTYPRVVGIEETRRLAREAASRAASALSNFGPAAAPLTALTEFVVSRTA